MRPIVVFGCRLLDDFDSQKLDPDIYVGACHKWMLAPKGTSFLYVKNEIQKKMKPLVISWGWESDSDDFMIKSGTSPFIDHHQWQ